MICPACKQTLAETRYRGIAVDRCTNCKGLWLDRDELDSLEDKVFDQDELKGTVTFSTSASDRLCPKCKDPLRKFNYRLYDLGLELCGQKHGFWLDRGEEDRVLKIMKEEKKGIQKNLEAEKNWARTLKKLKSPSFIDKLAWLLKR